MTSSENGNNPHSTDRGVTCRTSPATAQAGIDYFTATTTVDGVGSQWLSYFNFHKNVALDTGGRISTKSQWGFDMMYIDGLTWGYHPSGRYLMTASGANAHEYWQRVLPTASNISRLDLQVTFVDKKGQQGRVEKMFSRVKSIDAGKRMSSVILNSRGGQTLYVGSRASDQFGRYYYKHAEDPAAYPVGTYRLEVEYKKPRSLAMFEGMRLNMKNGEAAPQLINDTVVTWFEKRGVEVGLRAGGNCVTTQVSKTLTSDEKKIRWLRSAVSPSLVDLCGRGEFAKLAPALGLTKWEFSQLALFAPDLGVGVDLT